MGDKWEPSTVKIKGAEPMPTAVRKVGSTITGESWERRGAWDTISVTPLNPTLGVKAVAVGDTDTLYTAPGRA